MPTELLSFFIRIPMAIIENPAISLLAVACVTMGIRMYNAEKKVEGYTSLPSVEEILEPSYTPEPTVGTVRIAQTLYFIKNHLSLEDKAKIGRLNIITEVSNQHCNLMILDPKTKLYVAAVHEPYGNYLNDGELYAILAREIGHATLQHADSPLVRFIGLTAPLNFLLSICAMILSVSIFDGKQLCPFMISAVLSAITGHFISKTQYALEFQTDKEAIRLGATRDHLISGLEKLGTPRTTQGISFFSYHPNLTERKLALALTMEAPGMKMD